MGISDLVETIANSHGRFDTFYFEMKENIEGTTSYGTGEKAVSYEYPNIKTTFEFIRDSEEAIAFLFDADIHLWTLVSFEVSTHWHDSIQWTIRLVRYNKQ